jgi:Chitobiase/beta-hexosaminidase C-terminal domain
VGVVLDGSNSAYVLDSSSSAPTVTKFSYDLMGTPFVVVPSGTSVGGTVLSGPKGIAIDGYSNLYIADTGNNRIIQAHQYNAAYSQNVVYVSSTTTFAGTKLSGPTGMGLDASGNLFIADTGNSRIVEYSVTGVASVVSTAGVTLAGPTGVKVLPSGALVVTDSSKGLILIANGTGTVLTTGAITLANPQGLNLDLAGNIYVADSTGAQVVELNVNPPSATINFPKTLLGTSSPTTSSVYNSGNAALTFSAAPVILDNSVVSTNDFVLDSGNLCTGTTSVTAAGSCSLIMDFTPAATADLTNPTTGTVTLADNLQSYTVAAGIGNFGTTGSTQKVSLSGQAFVNATLQAITFTTATTSVTWSASIPPITLSATGGGSGNPVVFSILSGGGTLSGTNNNTLTLTAVGPTVIAANQTGGVVAGITYASAPQATLTITVAVPAPNFSVATGTYTSTQTVSISDTLSGTTIYYTLDGTTPSPSSTVFTKALTVGSTATLKAIAVKSGFPSSVVASATYSMTPDFTVALGKQTITIANGHADFEPITITPLAGFNSVVTISCSGLPVNYNCSFSLPTATPTWPTITSTATPPVTTLDPTAASGTVATSTLFIEPNAIASAKHPGASPFLPTATLATVLCFFGFRKRSRLLTVVLLVLSAAGLCVLNGCSSSAVPPIANTTSTITVTGTSGTTVRSATFTLVVTNF